MVDTRALYPTRIPAGGGWSVVTMLPLIKSTLPLSIQVDVMKGMGKGR
jgi:hypothetical protein